MWSDVHEETIFGPPDTRTPVPPPPSKEVIDTSPRVFPEQIELKDGLVSTIRDVKFLIHSTSDGAEEYDKHKQLAEFQDNLVSCIILAWLHTCSAARITDCTCTVNAAQLHEAIARLERAWQVFFDKIVPRTREFIGPLKPFRYYLTSHHFAQLIQLVTGSFKKEAVLNVSEFVRCCWWMSPYGRDDDHAPKTIHASHAALYDPKFDAAAETRDWTAELVPFFTKDVACIILQYAQVRTPWCPYIGLCSPAEVCAFLDKDDMKRTRSKTDIVGAFYLGYTGWSSEWQIELARRRAGDTGAGLRLGFSNPSHRTFQVTPTVMIEKGTWSELVASKDAKVLHVPVNRTNDLVSREHFKSILESLTLQSPDSSKTIS